MQHIKFHMGAQKVELTIVINGNKILAWAHTCTLLPCLQFAAKQSIILCAILKVLHCNFNTVDSRYNKFLGPVKLLCYIRVAKTIEYKEIPELWDQGKLLCYIGILLYQRSL